MIDELWSMAVASFLSLWAMPFLINSRALAPPEIASPQNIHRQPTSRLGGGAIFVAYSACILLGSARDWAASVPVLLLLACALPVFLAGVIEDVTHLVAPKQRLAAALLSAILASLFAGGVVARLDLPYVDGWLSYRLFAVGITCFMVVGACNALNIIDGANGLLGGTALLMFVGLAVVAAELGDSLVFVQAATMIGALAGFLYWNYPRAHIFMGDGGAYFIGFIYAGLSIQIVARNESLSAWFVVMLSAYPIIETLYSIYRRLIVLKISSTQPDALHLHSLLFHRVTLPAEKGRPDANRDLANALVTPRLWLHGFLCCALAVIFHKHTGALWAGLLGYVIFYVLHYRTLWKARKKRTDQAALGFQDRRREPSSRLALRRRAQDPS